MRTPPLILVAEDNPTNLELLVVYLEARGFRVSAAEDGETACRAAREESPSLMLMDAQMPGVDGLEACRRIKSDPTLASIPIVVVTALAMPGDRKMCLDAGADGYLTKPISFPDLDAEIKRWLDSSQDTPGGVYLERDDPLNVRRSQ